MARLVLPVAMADAKSVAEAVRKLEELTDGLPLLHLAVRSQSASLVRWNPLLTVVPHCCTCYGLAIVFTPLHSL